MATGGSVGSMARNHRGVVLFVAALFVFSLALFATSAASPRNALAASSGVVVTQEDGTNGCMGVKTTPSSENTKKELIGGSLLPGGTATFRITYPVDPADVTGRTTF